MRNPSQMIYWNKLFALLSRNFDFTPIVYRRAPSPSGGRLAMPDTRFQDPLPLVTLESAVVVAARGRCFLSARDLCVVLLFLFPPAWSMECDFMDFSITTLCKPRREWQWKSINISLEIKRTLQMVVGIDSGKWCGKQLTRVRMQH